METARATSSWQHTDGSTSVWLMDGLHLTSGGVVLGPFGWTAKVIGDFNGDGKSDIVWGHTDGSTAIWLMNGTTVISGGIVLAAGTGWSAIQTGDFDGDGKSDILWQNTDGSLAIWLMKRYEPEQRRTDPGTARPRLEC
jgi:hypothetical protein